MAYAYLLEQFENDGRACIAAGDERPPASFRELLDEVLSTTATEDVSQGRYVPVYEQELRTALGVA